MSDWTRHRSRVVAPRVLASRILPHAVLWERPHRPQVTLLDRHARPRIDQLQGALLDVRILTALSCGPAHGYSVACRLQLVTDDVLQVEEGSLYPALDGMERRGWLGAAWGLWENNRRAKYRPLTAHGR